MTHPAEAELQSAFLLAAPGALPEFRLFRRNVGTFRVVDPKSGRTRTVRFAVPGQCDLWGILQGGRHVEVELKSATGSLNKEQQAWKAFCEQWQIPYLLLKAQKDETKEQTIDRWLRELARLISVLCSPLEIVRVSGGTICPRCKRPYSDHPMARWPEALGYNGEPFLHVACDNRLLKL